MKNDHDAVQCLGKAYSVFHKNFERAQIAFVAVFLHLTGYKHGQIKGPHQNYNSAKNNNDNKNDHIIIEDSLENKKIKIACNLARQGVIDLISKSQASQYHKKSIEEYNTSSKNKKCKEEIQEQMSMEHFEGNNKRMNNVKSGSHNDFKNLVRESHQNINEIDPDDNNKSNVYSSIEQVNDLPLNKKKSPILHLSSDLDEKNDLNFCNFSKEELNYVNDVHPNGEKSSHNNKSNEFLAMDSIQKKREKQIEKILQKCEWIINTYPFGLCPVSVKENISQEWDEHFVFMRRNSYDIPITVRKMYSDRSNYQMLHEVATMPAVAVEPSVSSLSYLDQLFSHQNKINDDKLECIQFSTENIFGKSTTKNLFLLKKLLKTYKRNVCIREPSNQLDTNKYDKICLENNKQFHTYICNNKNVNFSNSCASCDSGEGNYYNDESNYYMNFHFSEKNNDHLSNNSLVLKYNNLCKTNNLEKFGELWLNARSTKNYVYHNDQDVQHIDEFNSNLMNYKPECFLFSLKSVDENDYIMRNENMNNVKWDPTGSHITKYTNSMFDYYDNASDMNLSELHGKFNAFYKPQKIIRSMNKQEFFTSIISRRNVKKSTISHYS